MLRQIKKFGWPLLAVVGALMAFFAQNSPEAVRSNLSHWFEEATALAGGIAPPAWLASPFADTVATWLGIGLVTLAVLGMAVRLVIRRRISATSDMNVPPPPASGDSHLVPSTARPSDSSAIMAPEPLELAAESEKKRGETKNDPGQSDLEAQLERRRGLIAAWRRMVDEVERECAAPGKGGSLRALLKKRSDYYQLEHFLNAETRAEMDAFVGIRVMPAIGLAGDETDTQRLLRLLRADIARIEREWGLV